MKWFIYTNGDDDDDDDDDDNIRIHRDDNIFNYEAELDWQCHYNICF